MLKEGVRWGNTDRLAPPSVPDGFTQCILYRFDVGAFSFGFYLDRFGGSFEDRAQDAESVVY